MGTKREVAFSVIFQADIDKRLLMANPYKPLVWKRFVDDIFSLWDISTKEVYNIVDFANTFHPTNIKFTCEISSECTVFLDTKVFKGPRLSTHKILDLQTHFKPTETFQYTHFSSCHSSNCKKDKREALHVQLLHLPQKFYFSFQPFWIPSQNNEYLRIFRVTGANQNAQKLIAIH